MQDGLVAGTKKASKAENVMEKGRAEDIAASV
jgi:hypothetical protein